MTKQLIIADRTIDVQYTYIGKNAHGIYVTPPEYRELVIERFHEGNKDVTELIERYCNRFDCMEAIEDEIKYW